ncbi:MAG: hypothetical protein WBP16_02055 [Ferruginibacter sp.]
MKKVLCTTLLFVIILTLPTVAQVKIGGTAGAPTASAMLQVESTTKGFLPPVMTTADMNLIAAPTNGLLVYNTDLNCIAFYNGTSWRSICPVTGEKEGTGFAIGDFTGNGNTKTLTLQVTPEVDRKIVVTANYIVKMKRDFNTASDDKAAIGTVELRLGSVNQINPDTEWAIANISGNYPYLNYDNTTHTFTADLTAGTTYSLTLRLTQTARNGSINASILTSNIKYIMY